MYLFDSDVLIKAKNLHYSFDVVPGFWDWLDAKFGVGEVGSVERVRDELVSGNDELARWIAQRRNRFAGATPAMANSLKSVTYWATSQQFTPAALQKFLSSADLHLIAFAHAHNHVVVTHEKSEPGARKAIKIPDVCLAFKVDCIGPFEMMRRESVRLVLGANS